MTQINLLPWREQARRQQKINFFITLGLFIGLAILLEILLHFIMISLINHQKRTNDFLQAQLTQEQSTVFMLNKKKKEGNKIYQQLQFLYGLQNKSYKAIKLMNSIANLIPEGIVLTKLSRENDNIVLIGKAKSNLQVSLLMENIAKSPIFNQPVLTEITGKDIEGNDEKIFQIKVVQLD